MLSTIECKRLLDIAFMASSQGYAGQARAILDGLEKVWPDSPEVKVCRAMSHYVVNDYVEALEKLAEVLKDDPGNEIAAAHLGVLYHLAGQENEARTELTRVAEQGTDPAAVELAKSMLKDVL